MFKNFKPKRTPSGCTIIQQPLTQPKYRKQVKNTTIYTGSGWEVYTIRTSSCESATPILFTSIILSADYKPLHFTPPIFTNIDAHKEGVTPTVFRPWKPPKRISWFDFTQGSPRPLPRLPTGSIKPQLDPQWYRLGHQDTRLPLQTIEWMKVCLFNQVLT